MHLFNFGKVSIFLFDEVLKLAHGHVFRGDLSLLGLTLLLFSILVIFVLINVLHISFVSILVDIIEYNAFLDLHSVLEMLVSLSLFFCLILSAFHFKSKLSFLKFFMLFVCFIHALFYLGFVLSLGFI